VLYNYSSDRFSSAFRLRSAKYWSRVVVPTVHPGEAIEVIKYKSNKRKDWPSQVLIFVVILPRIVIQLPFWGHLKIALPALLLLPTQKNQENSRRS